MDSNVTVIHTRFANDGSVREIGACPVGISLQDWFNALSRYPDKSYQALSGGRGIFQIDAGALGVIEDRLKKPAG